MIVHNAATQRKRLKPNPLPANPTFVLDFNLGDFPKSIRYDLLDLGIDDNDWCFEIFATRQPAEPENGILDDYYEVDDYLLIAPCLPDGAEDAVLPILEDWVLELAATNPVEEDHGASLDVCCENICAARNSRYMRLRDWKTAGGAA